MSATHPVGIARVDRAIPFASPRALRLVAVVALDCGAVAHCLGGVIADLPIWPSTLYAWLAEAATRSPSLWERCASVLDEALAPWLAPYRHAAPAAIAQVLVEHGGAAMDGREVAAALWALVRRRDPTLHMLIDRLTREAEILIARGARGL
jgi:hypothetical protein